MAAILGLLFCDHSLLSPNLTAAASDLGLDTRERDLFLGGILTFVVTGTAMVSALVFGTLADRWSRVGSFVLAVTLAELACLGILWARDWPHVLVLRMCTGIGLGGALPAAFAMVADLSSPRRRASSVALLWTALGAGIIVGVVVAGQLGPDFGWRVPFAVVALPNLLLVGLFGWLFRDWESRSRAIPDSLADAKISTRFRTIFAQPVNRWLYLEEVFEVVPFAVLSTFLPDFLAQDRGFSVAQGSSVLAAFGAAAILGKLAGGWLGDRLCPHGLWTLAKVASLALATAIVPALGILALPGLTDGGSFALVVSLAGLVGLLAPLPKPLMTTLLLEVNPASVHGSALAGHRLAAHVGQASGPLLAGLLMLLSSRSQALGILLSAWLVAAVLCWPVARALHNSRMVSDTTPEASSGNHPFG